MSHPCAHCSYGDVHDQLRRLHHARHRGLRRLCRDVPVRSSRARRGRLRPRDGAHRPAPGPGRLGPSVAARHSLTARRPVPCPPCESSPRGCSRSAARLASTQSASLRPRRSPGLGRRSSSASARACTAAWRSPTATRRARPIPMPRSRVRGRSSSGPARIASRRRPTGPGVARPRSVARYAWRRPLRLPAATGCGRSPPGSRPTGWKAVVVADDNALVDREAAHRAGLGWFGKNANLLLPGRGSWFVLGSVVTDAPLDRVERRRSPTAAARAHAASTAARPGRSSHPGVVDARRCLAWLLQTPGVVPARAPRRARRPHLRLRRLPGGVPAEPRGRPRPTSRRRRAAGGVGRRRSTCSTPPTTTLLDRHGRWYIADREPALPAPQRARRARQRRRRPTSPMVDAALRTYLDAPDDRLRAHAAGRAPARPRTICSRCVADDPSPLVHAEL